MKTSSGTSVPPRPPQPALTRALTPALFTASKMVSGHVSRQRHAQDIDLRVIAPGSSTTTDPKLGRLARQHSGWKRRARYRPAVHPCRGNLSALCLAGNPSRFPRSRILKCLQLSSERHCVCIPTNLYDLSSLRVSESTLHSSNMSKERGASPGSKALISQTRVPTLG